MALFNFYTKEGKGVEKDAPKPIRPVYFFELFFRSFSEMIKTNLLYILTSLPIWIIFFFSGRFLLSSISGTDELLTSLSYFVQVVSNPLSLGVLLILCFLWGPSTAAATYVYINYATETPIFLVSDYFEQFKKNFKQSSVIMMINIISAISTFLTWVVPIFPEAGAIENMQILSMFRLPTLIVFILTVFTNFYAYPIMVLFKMRLIDIIKNSLLFAFGRLPINLLLLVLALLPAFLLAQFFHPMIFVIAFLLILYSLGGFITVFGVYPTIEKYMLIPAKKKMPEEETNTPKTQNDEL